MNWITDKYQVNAIAKSPRKGVEHSGLRARPQSLKLAQDGRLKPGRDWDVSGSWQG